MHVEITGTPDAKYSIILDGKKYFVLRICVTLKLISRSEESYISRTSANGSKPRNLIRASLEDAARTCSSRGPHPAIRNWNFPPESKEKASRSWGIPFVSSRRPAEAITKTSFRSSHDAVLLPVCSNISFRRPPSSRRYGFPGRKSCAMASDATT